MGMVWSASSGYMLVGVDLWWHGNPADGFVTVEVKVLAKSDGYGHNFSSNWHKWGDSGEARGGFQFHSGFGSTVEKQLDYWSYTVPTQYGREGSVYVGAEIGPIWNGGHPVVENRISIPARPVNTPPMPRDVSAFRVTDSQINVSWAGVPASDSSPVDRYAIERRADRDNSWVSVAKVGRESSTYSDRGVSAGHVYKYRVRSENASGNSEWSESGPVFTKPPTPSRVKAVKNTDGSIKVTWESSAQFNPTQWDIYDGDEKIHSILDNVSQMEWIHRNPPLSKKHSYRIVFVGGDVSSDKSAPSNVIQLLSPPNDADPISNGVYFPSDSPVVVKWRYNPTDSSPQTRAIIVFRRDDGDPFAVGFTNQVDVKTDQQQASIGTLSPGTYAYSVMTFGMHSTPSDPTNTGYFYVEDRPKVSLLEPATSSVKTSFTSAKWSYSHAGGSKQSSAVIRLVDNSTNEVVEKITIIGDATSTPLSTYLKDGGSYTISVVSTNEHGVDSLAAEKRISVSYEKPPVPKVYVSWDDNYGRTLVRVENPAPTAGKPAAVRNRVERSNDGGITWEIITDILPVSGSLNDYESLSHGTVKYRVTAISSLPSSSVAEVSIDISSWAMWISGSTDFSISVPLRWDPVHSCKMGLTNRKIYRFAGRKHGVELSGTHRSKSLSLSSTLFDEDWYLIQRLEELSYTPGPFLYRDPMGRIVYCSMSDISADRALSGKWSVKMDIEEVDR